jgi:hypothetical protein
MQSSALSYRKASRVDDLNVRLPELRPDPGHSRSSTSSAIPRQAGALHAAGACAGPPRGRYGLSEAPIEIRKAAQYGVVTSATSARSWKRWALMLRPACPDGGE